MTTREDILSLAEDLEDGVQRNGTMDGEDGAVDLYDIDAANEVMGEAAKMLRTLAAPTPPAAETPTGRYPLDAAVWFRESTQEWVLELSGTLGDTNGTWRHTQPAETPIDDVPGLGSLYAAEAPGQEPVAVKPLEWRGPNFEDEYFAGAVGGTYTISRCQETGRWFGGAGGIYRSADAAKAATQAAYEQRIRSALVSAPPTYADAETKGGTDRLIDCLTDGEGDTVTFCSPNADFNGLPNECVMVNGGWTDWQDRAFRADTRRQCLLEAAAAIRSLASPAPKEPGQ